MEFLQNISNENNMVRTIIAKDWIKDIGWFIQRDNYFYEKLP